MAASSSSPAAVQPPWWQPQDFARRRPVLEVRARILAALRQYFADAGFIEVETPALQISPGLDVHLMAFAADYQGPLPGQEQRYWLHTSPEFAMKKLLVAGMERIFQVARVFRNGEWTPLHHPEFTMLEWYRAGAGCAALRQDCQALVQVAVHAAAQTPAANPDPSSLRWLRRGGLQCDPFAPPEVLTVAEAFQRYAGIDLLATTPDPLAPDAAGLAAAAAAVGVHTAADDSWEDVFFRIMLERIEPRLGIGRMTFLCDYPLSLACLARPHPDDPRLAERFEMYVNGVELANAFAELTDPGLQRQRFEADLARKQALYATRYPIDEDFLAALACGMPESAGIALGLDRLVMLCTGMETLEAVLWCPVAAPEQATGSSPKTRDESLVFGGS